MTNYEQTLKRIQADERYLKNLDWGEPRKGHPEGSVRHHIADLEGNLARLKPKLTDQDYWNLLVLIHTHDTFKADATQGVAISNPNSHASLARQFLTGYTDDQELLDIVQLHDEPYALWKKHQAGGDYSQRLEQLLGTITNWDLFLAFLVIDGNFCGSSLDLITTSALVCSAVAESCRRSRSSTPLAWACKTTHRFMKLRKRASPFGFTGVHRAVVRLGDTLNRVLGFSKRWLSNYCRPCDRARCVEVRSRLQNRTQRRTKRNP